MRRLLPRRLFARLLLAALAGFGLLAAWVWIGLPARAAVR